MGPAQSGLTLVEGMAIAVAVVACLFDLRTRRIPNALTLGAAGAGLVFHAVTGGGSGAVGSLGGCLLGAGLFFPLFVLGGMGAGDVKLAGALGAWLGPGQAVWVVLSSAVAGGVLGLAYALAIGYARTAVTNVLALLTFWWTVGLKPVPELTLANQKVPRFPYALPIVIGTIITVWLR